MIEVVAAAIFLKEKILCFQRGKGKYDYISFKYEFPGGKIKPGENHKDALRRELLEELEIEVTVNDKIITVEHAYPNFEIKMHCFHCETEAFNGQLKEHVNYKLLRPSELPLLDWIEADRPIVEMLAGERFDTSR